MGSRGQLLGVGWQGSSGGCREAVAPERSASSSRPRPRGAERRNRLGPASLPAGDRRGDPPRSHTRTGCPARAGHTGPAAFPGHPRISWPRPRTPRRPLRPRSGPAARQPQLRARLGSAGLGLLFGRDASSKRRLTRGGRAGTGASAFSSRSAPIPPSRTRRKCPPQDSPHRRPPGSPGQHRWPRRRPRVPQIPRAAEDCRRAEPSRASGRAAREGARARAAHARCVF